MIIYVQYRLPGNDSATVVNCVEMTEEEYQSYVDRLIKGEDRRQVAMEADASHPNVTRKHWQYAKGSI